VLIGNYNLQTEENNIKLNIDFRNEIKNNSLQMIIYYNSNYLTPFHMTDGEIRGGRYEYKITVNTKVLDNYLIKILELNNIEFERGFGDAMYDAEANRRIVCDFINDKNETILSFTFGHGRYVYLNSTIIKRNDYLRSFLYFFLNESIAFIRDYPEIPMEQ
jgi:hypothetical protein